MKWRVAGAQVFSEGTAMPKRMLSAGFTGTSATSKAYFCTAKLLMMVMPIPASIIPRVATVSMVS